MRNSIRAAAGFTLTPPPFCPMTRYDRNPEPPWYKELHEKALERRKNLTRPRSDPRFNVSMKQMNTFPGTSCRYRSSVIPLHHPLIPDTDCAATQMDRGCTSASTVTAVRYAWFCDRYITTRGKTETKPRSYLGLIVYLTKLCALHRHLVYI